VKGGGATEQNLFARTLPAQELAVAAVTAANAVSLLVLRGQRRRLAGAGPPGGRDWLRTVPRLNSFVFFGAAAFFLWLSWQEAGPRRGAPYGLLLFADALTMAAVSMRTAAAFTPREEAEAEAEEA